MLPCDHPLHGALVMAPFIRQQITVPRIRQAVSDTHIHDQAPMSFLY